MPLRLRRLSGSRLILKDKIKEGQIWSYKSRSSEPGSKLTVIKLDTPGNEQIVHISVDSLRITQRNTGEVTATYIEHLPMSLDAFSKSVIKIESIVETSINEGYLDWKNKFDEGKAGVWSLEISEVIEMIENIYTDAPL